MNYGIALHFIHKVGTEKVPLRLWAVKSHLKWITPTSVEKQAAYFWKQNGIPISFNLARTLCKSNENVDRIAKDAAYGAIPVEDSMKVLSKEIFDPLPLSEDCLKNFSTILLRDPI